jgi:hypothetical protein
MSDDECGRLKAKNWHENKNGDFPILGNEFSHFTSSPERLSRAIKLLAKVPQPASPGKDLLA